MEYSIFDRISNASTRTIMSYGYIFNEKKKNPNMPVIKICRDFIEDFNMEATITPKALQVNYNNFRELMKKQEKEISKIHGVS